jgi:hypothetical protein
MKVECSREQDVLDTLAAQRWPERCDDELRVHVSGCHICTDLAQVAMALLDDHESAHQDARLQPSGIVWWRAQLRAREEAARAAARPIAFIQGVAASVAVWLIVAIARAVPSSAVLTMKESIAGLVPRMTLRIPDLAQAAGAVPISILLLAGAWLLLAPLAIYFAVHDE